jgi:hypothetical protein
MMKKEIPESLDKNYSDFEKIIVGINNIKNIIGDIDIEDFIKNNVILPNELFEELYNDSLKLAALEAAGVDNWENYDEAMELMEEEEWEEEEEDG